MRNSKAKLLRRIALSYLAGNLHGPNSDLTYKQLKAAYPKAVSYGAMMYTPRHELVRQGNWRT